MSYDPRNKRYKSLERRITPGPVTMAYADGLYNITALSSLPNRCFRLHINASPHIQHPIPLYPNTILLLYVYIYIYIYLLHSLLFLISLNINIFPLSLISFFQ